MMRRRSFTPPRPSSRPSSRASTDGFTLIELLVSLAVGVMLVGLAVQVAVADRRVMDADMRRVATNQTVRTALDLVATDLRQAGEEFNQNISPIIVTNGTNGASDRLAVRRQLTDQTLKLCADLSVGAASVQVSVPTSTVTPSPPDGCRYSGSGSSPVPPNLAVWEALRAASPNGTLRAFIYNPTDKVGEYFTYTGISGNATTQVYSVLRGGGSLSRSYAVSKGPILILLEEREYFVQNNQLTMRMNADAATDQPISPDITNLSVTVDVDTGTASAPNVVTRSSFVVGDDWKRIVKLDIGVSGAITENARTTARTLTTSVFPRNVLSK